MPHLFRRHEPAVPADWLIVGLGNPGSEYAGNRHNVGFWAINRLARAHGIKLDAKGKLASSGDGTIDSVRAVLAKPRTYVNRSGDAIRPLLDRCRLSPDKLIVVHDDLDLPAGRVRIRKGGGHGGHNGMRSIVAAVGGDFVRIRIGIGRPALGGEPTWDPEVIAAYVLGDPDPEERAILDKAVAVAIEALETLLRDGLEAAMSRYNRERP